MMDVEDAQSPRCAETAAVWHKRMSFPRRRESRILKTSSTPAFGKILSWS